jgi:hypothetical protein
MQKRSAEILRSIRSDLKQRAMEVHGDFWRWARVFVVKNFDIPL